MIRIGLGIISILLNIHIVRTLSVSEYGPILILEWLFSIFFLISSFFISTIRKIRRTHFAFSKNTLVTVVIILLPSIVRILALDVTRIHGDEMLVGFFSSTHNFLTLNFFSGIPQDKTQWQSQFPSLFFALQRLFFLGFKETLLSIKVSIIPYVLLISIMLFLSVREIFDRKIAYLSLFIYSFLAISLYYETLGLIFISATAAFMVFFYALILYIKKKNTSSVIFVGLSCGLCYLFYITSYIALPILIIVLIYEGLKMNKRQFIYHCILFVVSFWILLGPFITQAFLFDNYFISRTNQVSLLTGTDSAVAQKIAHGQSPLIALSNSTSQFFQSFYTHGIGGAGGFDFAHQAIFDTHTFLLFIGGIMIGLIWMVRKKELILVFVTFLGACATVIFAIPPPGYHRFTLAFPFIAIILSLSFSYLISVHFIPRNIRFSIGAFFLIYFAIINLQYFIPSIKNERNNTNLQIASVINSNYPERNLYIAAFPGYAFEKVYYFSPHKTSLKVYTEYHDNLLKSFNANERYIYLVTMPEIFNSQLQQKDPHGRVIPYSNEFSLFVNE